MDLTGLRNYKMDNKSKIKITPYKILEMLMNGIEVPINDYIYAMGDEYDLYVVGSKVNKDGSDGEKVFLRSDMYLSDFLRLCEEIKEKDFVLAAADLSLRKIKNENKKY